MQGSKSRAALGAGARKGDELVRGKPPSLEDCISEVLRAMDKERAHTLYKLLVLADSKGVIRCWDGMRRALIEEGVQLDAQDMEGGIAGAEMPFTAEELAEAEDTLRFIVSGLGQGKREELYTVLAAGGPSCGQMWSNLTSLMEQEIGTMRAAELRRAYL